MAYVLLAATIGFGVGVLVGYISSMIYNREEPIGDLRIDNSIPEEGPQLFLELSAPPTGLEKRKQVTLNVKNKNYVSQK